MALFRFLDVRLVLLFPLGGGGKKTQYGFYGSVDCMIIKVCLCVFICLTEKQDCGAKQLFSEMTCFFAPF